MTAHDATEAAYKNGYVAGIKEKLGYIDCLQKRCEELKKERDAAIADLSSTTSACDFCSGRFCENTPIDSGGCRFEWRGVQE